VIEINIPGFRHLQLHHLVLEYNGTLAGDGKLFAGIKETLHLLSEKINIHILTADTFGTVRDAFKETPCTIAIIKQNNEDKISCAILNNLAKKRPCVSVTAVMTGRCCSMLR
jgi:soluble P-type ATPase